MMSLNIRIQITLFSLRFPQGSYRGIDVQDRLVYEGKMISNEIAKRLKDAIQTNYPTLQLIGCTDKEVIEIMDNQGILFIPELYKQVLKAIGKVGINHVFDAEGSYSNLITMKPYVQKLFPNNIDLSLPDDAFVVAIHHDYIFLFFSTAQKLEDPPVYGYTEGSKNWVKSEDKLSDIWMQYIRKVEGNDSL